jgi:hypothetical protein
MSKTVPYVSLENGTHKVTDNAYAQEQKNEDNRNKNVNHPDYYKTGGIEAIDVIEAWNLGFCLGNTVKYISRAGRKSNKIIEDLEKARWYLDREIKTLKNKENKL